MVISNSIMEMKIGDELFLGYIIGVVINGFLPDEQTERIIIADYNEDRCYFRVPHNAFKIAASCVIGNSEELTQSGSCIGKYWITKTKTGWRFDMP